MTAIPEAQPTTIEGVLRGINRDVVPQFEERLRAALAGRDREWLQYWLRAEGAAGLALGWLAWLAYGGEPIWFLPLLLVPDLSVLGYVRGPRIGAHNYARVRRPR